MPSRGLCDCFVPGSITHQTNQLLVRPHAQRAGQKRRQNITCFWKVEVGSHGDCIKTLVTITIGMEILVVYLVKLTFELPVQLKMWNCYARSAPYFIV